MIYKQQYIRRLANALAIRYEELQRALQAPSRGFAVYEDADIKIDAMDIRLAVEDFKTIFSEVKRLK